MAGELSIFKRLLAAGTNVIGKLAANSGVDIGDVDVTSIIPGIGATNLGKAEDAAHTSGDVGVQLLGVRSDAGISLAGSDGDYAVVQTDQHGGLRTGRPVFGEPTSAAANNGCANWAQGIISPLDQKSPTGWLACLYGGAQTGDDWSRINIPVDELLLTKFTGTTTWSYWMTNAETMGVNIVFWVHDPADPGKRAEITQLANVSGLGKAGGWNSHVFNPATTQMFYYGENTTGTALVAGTQYTFNQFIADVLFSTWTIYRITIEYGWEASGTFEDAFVADIKLNGIAIPLKPDSGGSGRTMVRRWTATSGAIAAAFVPKTPFTDLVVGLHLASAATQETLTIVVDAGAGTTYDETLLSIAMGTNAVTDLTRDTGNQKFVADDEIDVAWANTDGADYGLTMSCRTV